MNNRIRVDGIKLSRELIHINILQGPEKNVQTRLLASMAEHRINCPMLFCSAMDGRCQGAVCVAAEDSRQLDQVLAMDPELKENVQCISPVGAVSMFPHKFNLKFLGCLMHVFGKTDLPMYGMTASLSALTLTTDYDLLDTVIATLEPYISLPSNHAPFRSQLRLKEI
jgi:hypothetical protein